MQNCEIQCETNTKQRYDTCLTSFNYDGKEAWYVGLTCRCHLSNIMPDDILND